MRRLKFLCAAFALAAVLVFSGGYGQAGAAPEEYYIGGMTAGFSLSAGGTEIIGFTEVIAEDGRHTPAEDAGLKVGDTICAADGLPVRSIGELGAALAASGGREMQLTVRRCGEETVAPVVPVKEKKSGKYKLGVLIRDALSGIGTVTYIRKSDRRFGALGHAVCDENNNALEIADKKIYLCSIVGVNRGKRGRAGELHGLFMNDRLIASAEMVCETGLYGNFEKDYDFSSFETVQAAPLTEAEIGAAYIYSTVDGVCPQRYEVAIAKVDAGNRENKNFVVKITDEKLLAETGGIVQGMSGSPILQHGKLIGAITHVFVNDPARGYGIGIEKMLGN